MIALKIFLLPDLIIFVKLLLGLAQDISLPGWWEVDSFTICVCVSVCLCEREIVQNVYLWKGPGQNSRNP